MVSFAVAAIAAGPLVPAGGSTAIAGDGPASSPGSGGAKPATVEGGRIQVSAEAERRLGIEVTVLHEVEVTRWTVRAGVIDVPDDRRARITAPFAGRLAADGRAWCPGDAVAAGQVVAALEVGTTPDGAPVALSDRLAILRARTDLESQRLAATGREDSARAALESARAALARAVALEKDAVGSERRVEEARAAVADAEASAVTAAATAEDLTRALAALDALEGSGVGTRLPLVAPIDGQVAAVGAHPGQALAAGAAVVEVIDRTRPWVRVSSFHTEAARLRDVREARVGSGDADDAGDATRAHRVLGVGRGDPTTGAMELVFALDDDEGRHEPGETVSVWLRLGSSSRRVVPRSALVHDEVGRAFVYVRESPGTYRRVRVDPDDAVSAADRTDLAPSSGVALEDGPAAGAQVVVTGAAELFGVEFTGG